MALLILLFLATVIFLSFTLWSMTELPEGPFNPFITVTGLTVALLGLYGIIRVYTVFPPHVMLSRTIKTLPWEVVSLFQTRDRGECKGNIKIVVEGPYSCVRHPLYSSVTLFFLGLSFIKAPLLITTATLFIAYRLLGYIEERYLNQVTCGEYEKAMKGIPSINPLLMMLCILKDLANKLRRRA